jgi:hypothetical protein
MTLTDYPHPCIEKRHCMQVVRLTLNKGILFVVKILKKLGFVFRSLQGLMGVHLRNLFKQLGRLSAVNANTTIDAVSIELDRRLNVIKQYPFEDYRLPTCTNMHGYFTSGEARMAYEHR